MGLRLEDIDYRYGFSDVHSILLCVMTTLSSLLSFFGSGSIIYSVLSAKRNNRQDGFGRVYNRFMLAVSTADILVTFGFVAGVWLYPAESGLKWAFGNTAMCTAAAFFVTFFVSISITLCNLALYFYWTVALGWKDEWIAAHCEKPMHAVAFLSSLGLALAQTFTETANPAKFGRLCSIEFYPIECDEIEDLECTRGGTKSTQIFGATLVLQLIPTVVAMICTYRVYRTTKRASHRGTNSHRRQRKVTTQAILYFLSYFHSFMWPVIAGVASLWVHIWDYGGPVYILIFLAHLMVPLQGFFNYFIFKRRSFNACSACMPSDMFDSGDLSGDTLSDEETGGRLGACCCGCLKRHKDTHNLSDRAPTEESSKPEMHVAGLEVEGTQSPDFSEK